MSAICRSGFVENAWRRDLCSNCFRTREEHAPPNPSTFQYQAHQQPLYNSWRNGGGPAAPTTIHIKSDYGLPPANGLGPGSRYQSPSVGSGINQLGIGTPRPASGSASGPRSGTRPPTQNGPSRTLYSTYNTEVSGSPGTGKIISSSQRHSSSQNGGISVTVNGGNNMKPKVVPQAALRSLGPRPLPGGGVSVSVGRSSSYSSQLNTVGYGYGGLGPPLTQQQRRGMMSNGVGNGPSPAGPAPASVSVLTQAQAHPTAQQARLISSTTTAAKNLNGPRPGAAGGSLVAGTEMADGEVGALGLDRKLVMSVSPPVATARVSVGNNGNGGASKGPAKGKKGILRKLGTKRKLSVTFPQEVCKVIGYGGASSDEESEDEIVPDPLDSASVAEILDKSSVSPLEKELNRTTLKNTNFNAIKNNLLGYAPIDIGIGIVGKTGGTSKPLVSIGTFEARKEPLRVRKLGEDEDVPILRRQAQPPKNSKAPISKTVTNQNQPPPPKQSPPIASQPKQSPPMASLPKQSPPIASQPKQSPPIVSLPKQSPPISAPPPKAIEIIQKVHIDPPKRPQEVVVVPEAPAQTTVLTASVPLTNLIILNEGNIASKRTSFLREIIHEPAAAPLPEDSKDSLDPPRVIKSELKLELSPCDYDDSLEADSGLDISRKAGESPGESDTEKSGSNSDSGNENDFRDRLCSRMNSSNSNGLFITTTDEIMTAKLSPDSVISDSSEGSGSQESIPTQVDLEEVPVSTGPPIPLILKRTAPPPPRQEAQPYSVEDLYDDVAAAVVEQEQEPESEEEDDENDNEESLYDDCTAGANPPKTANAKGSYDFTDTNGGGMGLDTEAHEKIPLRQDEGIEFLGIRKIDSESFLRQQSPPPQPSPKKEGRAGSVSPKPKRRVNQFFSTIGKRAGAAFNRTNSHTPLEKVTPLSPAIPPFSAHRRSLSQDEVNMTRTQELYATLTPTSLKMRGLAPVLGKLSRLDLGGSNDDPGKKKSKFGSSLKKFLRIGPKDDEKYDLSTAKTQFVATQGRAAGKTLLANRNSAEGQGPLPALPRPQDPGPIRPPPPPPRIHSLDLLNSVGSNGGHGTVKPARPPPPTRLPANKVAPSFVSVFASQEDESSYDTDSTQGPYGESNPPNKPKRKASMRNGESGGGRGDGGAYSANYLETTYNHITSLNFETLKLIASQTPVKIRRQSSQQHLKFSKSPLRWSQFYVTDVEPASNGKGFAFYSAFWEDEPCILLLQESLSCGILPLEFDCVETLASFEDVVQPQFVTWEPSDYVNTGNGVRVFITVLASCTVQKLPHYINNPSISPSRKYYALLQAMDSWGREEMSDLLVFHQVPAPSAVPPPAYDYSSKSKSSPSPNFGLVYVVSARVRSGSSSLSHHPSRSSFEICMKQLLFTPIGPAHTTLLCENDRETLLRRILGTTEEVEAQLRLFLQLKLFGPQGGDLDKILRYRSEKQVTQWMDKERAFCMKDAIERTLQRNSEPISPLRKSFVEFLMISDNCAKAVLDLVVDLYPDL